MASDTLDELRQEAQQALAQGEYQQARQLYHLALGLQVDSPDVHYGLATACFLLGDLNGAAYHFQEVTRLDPVRSGAFVNLGAVYNRLGKIDDAIVALRKGIKLDPRKAEGYYNLGVIYRQRDQVELAIQAYREAARINPRMPDAHYNLANIYLEKDHLGIAIAHYRQALELRPDWEKAKRGLETALARQSSGDDDTALEAPPTKAVKVKLDPERMLDPNIHGDTLRHVHQLVIDVDRDGHRLLEIIQQDVDKAIRDLSTCLLFPKTPGNDLNGQMQKFDAAMNHLRQVQGLLRQKMRQIQELGEHVGQI